jgi:hypothetical protein
MISSGNTPFVAGIQGVGRHPGFFGLYQFHIKVLSSLARLRQLNVHICTPRSLSPRRLDIILDLELELGVIERPT